MKKIKLFRHLFMILILLHLMQPWLLQGQSDGEYGTTSNLSYGPGARALALGRAYVSVANDPTAVFWNPAGLELVPRISLTLFHNMLFESTVYDFIGFVYPTLTYGTVGIGFARLGTSDIPVVDKYNVKQGNMNYEEAEVYVSYGKKMPYNLYGGITFKIRRSSFSYINQDATGLGMDLGLMYQPGWEGGIFQNLNFGFGWRNLVSPSLKLGSESEQEPAHITFGLVKGLKIGENNGLNVALDLHTTKYEGMAILFGTEYLFRDFGTIRLGYDNSSFAIGAGVKYSFVTIDYSFGSTMSDGEFPPTHRFSFSFDIGKSREELFVKAERERIEREKELVARTKEEERQNLISESMNKGQDYLTEGRYFDAYSEFQQVVSVDPFNKRANVLMDSANTLIQMEFAKREQEAISSAIDKQLAEENQKFVQEHFEKGNAYLQNKRFTDALVEFNMALERSPGNSLVLQAIQSTNRQMQGEVRRLITRGREEFSNGNYSEAIIILNEALVLSPEDARLKEEIRTLATRIKIQQFVQRALQYYDLGQFEEALDQFEEALKLDPSNQRLRDYVERTKAGMGITDQTMDQESERRYIEGVDLFLAGRYQDALKIWRELEQKYPYNKKLQDAIKSAEDRLKTQ